MAKRESKSHSNPSAGNDDSSDNPEEIIKHQQEKLMDQRQEFKKLIAELESSSTVAKNQAIALKLQLEVTKIVGFAQKARHSDLLRGFRRYHGQVTSITKETRTKQLIVFSKIQARIRGFVSVVRGPVRCAMRSVLYRWRTAPRAFTDYTNQIAKAKSEFTRLKRKAEKLRDLETELRQSAQETASKPSDVEAIEAENKMLREKLAATEANVGIFVREMGSLLDQHEPPPASMAPAPQKGVKISRAYKKGGISRHKGTSPDGHRRSAERKSYLHFD